MNTRDSVLAAAKKNGLEAVEQVFSELMEKIEEKVLLENKVKLEREIIVMK